MKRSIAWLLILIVLLSTRLASAEPLQIVVSLLPQQYLAERIAGDLAAITVIVGPGHSPATHEPSTRQLQAVSRAQLYWRIGTAFETIWLPRFQSLAPGMQVLDARDGIELRYFEDEHGHHDDHDHEAGSADPHIWLNPLHAISMSRAFAATLAQLDPVHAETYQANLNRLIQDLEQLDKDITNLLAPLRGHSFLVFHPSWGYFADRYGLEQLAIEQNGKQPRARQLAGLIDQAKALGIRVIFVQQQFSQREAATIARAIDGKVITVDPLAYDYLDNLRATARRFREALQ